MVVCVVCCQVKTKDKIQDNQDKETSTDEVQSTKDLKKKKRKSR
jgi:hypothetical protein